VVTAGCAIWQAAPVSVIPETNPRLVRLVDGYGVRRDIANPRVSGDTVYGTAQEDDRAIAFPLSQVERILIRRVDRGRTAVLVAGLTFVGAIATYAISLPRDPQGRGCIDITGQPAPCPS
jgi:hypothetical protein